jgi:Flp pilus assembly protein TadG
MLLLRAFLQDRRGIAALEFVLVTPIVVLLLLGSVTLFVMVREDQTAKMSTYTISDMVARRTRVDDGYLDFTYALFLNVAHRSAPEAGLRITSVSKAGAHVKVDWSYAKAPLTRMNNAMIPLGRLPQFSDGESLMITETTLDYSPVSALLGWREGQRYNVSVSRPRFVAKVIKN